MKEYHYLKSAFSKIEEEFEKEAEEKFYQDRTSLTIKQLSHHLSRYLDSLGIEPKIGYFKIGKDNGIVEIEGKVFPFNFQTKDLDVTSFQIDLEDYLSKKGVKDYLIELSGKFYKSKGLDGKTATKKFLESLFKDKDYMDIDGTPYGKSSIDFLTDKLIKDGKVKIVGNKLNIKPGSEIWYVEENNKKWDLVERVKTSNLGPDEILLKSGKTIYSDQILEIKEAEEEPIYEIELEEEKIPSIEFASFEVKEEKEPEVPNSVVDETYLKLKKESVKNLVLGSVKKELSKAGINPNDFIFDILIDQKIGDEYIGRLKTDGDIKGEFTFVASVENGSLKDLDLNLDIIKGFYGVREFEIDAGELGKFNLEAVSEKRAVRQILSSALQKGKEISYKGVRITEQNLDYYLPRICKSIKIAEKKIYRYPVGLRYKEIGSKDRVWEVEEKEGENYLVRKKERE